MLSEAHTLYSEGDWRESRSKHFVSETVKTALEAIKGQRNEILSGYACMRKMTNDSFEE